MKAEALEISGAWSISLQQFHDSRGFFAEWFRQGMASELLGRNWQTAQANVSHSRHGVVRGIHYALTPPGQAKWVTCLQGRIIDYVVDIRLGSPTYGKWVGVELDASRGDAILIAEGLGHAFAVQSEDALVAYLVDQPFNPEREFSVSPIDPEIGLPLASDLVISDRDLAAPTLQEARELGQLPRYLS